MTKSAYELTLAAVIEQSLRRGRRRQRISPGEIRLLHYMLNRGLEPIQQHPVGRYDLDFYFPAAQLCVEVDGRQHEAQQAKDARRDEYLRERGIDTLRIPIRLVEACPDECAALVQVALDSLDCGKPYPTGLTGSVLGILERLREERIREWKLTWRPRP